VTGCWSLQKDQIFWWNHLRRIILGEWVLYYSNYWFLSCIWFYFLYGEILFGVAIKNVAFFFSFVFFNLAFTFIMQKMKWEENNFGWPIFWLKTREYREGQGKLKRKLLYFKASNYFQLTDLKYRSVKYYWKIEKGTQ
jgi:hypothetical protein